MHREVAAVPMGSEHPVAAPAMLVPCLNPQCMMDNVYKPPYAYSKSRLQLSRVTE